jgi:polar amino acid transport system substrate-binding protein
MTGAALAAVVTGCASIPADPDGTLERVTGGELRVGVSHNPPFTTVPDSGEPGGSEADLIREFAESLDASIEWVDGGEEALMLALENGRLDLVIGGLTSDTPWTDSAGVTRPYRESTNDLGHTLRHVMAVPLGENGFLVELETFLHENGGSR